MVNPTLGFRSIKDGIDCVEVRLKRGIMKIQNNNICLNFIADTAIYFLYNVRLF